MGKFGIQVQTSVHIVCWHCRSDQGGGWAARTSGLRAHRGGTLRSQCFKGRKKVMCTANAKEVQNHTRMFTNRQMHTCTHISSQYEHFHQYFLTLQSINKCHLFHKREVNSSALLSLIILRCVFPCGWSVKLPNRLIPLPLNGLLVNADLFHLMKLESGHHTLKKVAF